MRWCAPSASARCGGAIPCSVRRSTRSISTWPTDATRVAMVGRSLAPIVRRGIAFPLSDRSDQMADFMKILQQAQEMQGKLQQVQEELQQQTVTASAGGGMVTVEANGQGTVRSVKIDPSVVNPADVEMLEDLVLVAVTEVQKKAQALAQSSMGKLTGGLNLPFKLPF